MTQNSQWKIKELIIDIFIPGRTSNEIMDFLKKASEDCHVTRNLSQEIDIKLVGIMNKFQKNYLH